MDLDPRFACKCEFEANLEQIYQHDLGPTCGDDPIIDIVGGSGPEMRPNAE